MEIDRTIIYFVEFREQFKNFRLEIMPAGGAELTSPTYEEISEEGVLSVSNLSSKFKDPIPLGIVSADSIDDLELDLLMLPDNLVALLATPFYKLEASIDTSVDDDAIFSRVMVYPSNIFILKSKDDGGEWKTIFIGAQKESIERNYEVSSSSCRCKLTILHISKLITTQITPEQISTAVFENIRQSKIYVKYSNRVIDFAYFVKDQKNQDLFLRRFLTHGYFNPVTKKFDLHAVFVKAIDLFRVINSIIDGYYKIWLRNSDYSFSVTGTPLDSILYRKQAFINNYRGKGHDLNSDEIYFVAAYHVGAQGNFISVFEDTQQGGFLINSEDNNNTSIYEYKNAWDFIGTITEAKAMKCIFQFTDYNAEMKYLKMWETNVSNSPINPFFLNSIEQFNALAEGGEYKKEVIGNNKAAINEDVEEVIFSNRGSLTDTNFEFEPVFNNMPNTLPDPEDCKIIHCNNNYFISSQTDFDCSKLYYFEDSLSVNEMDIPYSALTSDMVRVHETCKISTGLTDYEDLQVSMSSLDEIHSGYDIYGQVLGLNEAIIKIQKSSNEVQAVAKLLGTEFGFYDQVIWEAKFDNETAIYPFNVGDVMAFDNRIDFFLSSFPFALRYIYSMFAKVNDEYRKCILVDSDFELVTGITTCKFFIRGNNA